MLNQQMLKQIIPIAVPINQRMEVKMKERMEVKMKKRVEVKMKKRVEVNMKETIVLLVVNVSFFVLERSTLPSH